MTAPEPREPEGQRHGGTLRDYLQMLRRRKWIVLQAIVLVPAIAIAISLRSPARYEAQAQVLLTHQSFAALLTNTQDQSSNQQLADRVANTQADLARVPPVVQRTLAAVPGAGLTGLQLLHSSTVTARQNADLLTFAVTARSPELATRLATAYAQSYTAYRHELDTASLQRAREDVGTRIASLRANHQGASALAAKLVETEQQLQTLQTLQTANATVVKIASVAPQVSPRPWRDAILGVVFGTLIGLGLALVIEALDTRVRSGEEVAERLGVSLLGRLPEPPKKLRDRNALVMLEEPYGQHAEAFRTLRTNIELSNLEREATVIAVASALPSEGKSTTAANLAVAIARGGHRVALVDLDLRKPILATFFKARAQPGLTDVALGRVTLEQALIRINVATFSEEADVAGHAQPQLDVLIAGRPPPNPGEFVSSRRLANILATLRESYDVVLVDTPPMLSVGDTLALTSQLDALMLVSNLSLTKRGELHELRRVLALARCQILGTVLTAAGVDRNYGYGYGYGSYGLEPKREGAGTPTGSTDV
jgi:capsular exopolysaccharide synthesis family protein